MFWFKMFSISEVPDCGRNRRRSSFRRPASPSPAHMREGMQGGKARKFTLFFSNDQFISLFFSFLSVVSANFSKRALSAAQPGGGFRPNRAAARKEHNPQTLPIAGPQPVALAMPRMPRPAPNPAPSRRRGKPAIKRTMSAHTCR